MTLTWQMYAIVCPLIFFAALVDSVAGGGGLISLPAYYLAGLPPVLASGSNKMSATLGAVMSVERYARAKKIPWREGLVALAGAVPGSFLGAYLLTLTPPDTARMIVVCALPQIAAFVLRKREMTPRKWIPDTWSLPACLLVGVVIGVYDGFIGPGTGTFLTLIFCSLLGMDLLFSAGSARLVNLGSNIGALIAMMLGGHILYALALPAAAFSVAGSYVGSNLALKKGPKLIRKMLLIVLVLIFVKLLVDIFS